MSDAYTPIRGKCRWWRELPIDDDLWNTRLAKEMRRTECTCFIEGRGWVFTQRELPDDCPEKRACRYYIKHT